MTCCFTGHRRYSKEMEIQLKKELSSLLPKLIQKGYTRFCTGGALGFDTLAAQAVLEQKQQFPGVHLILVLPCLNQSQRWTTAQKEVYASILSQADQVIYTGVWYKTGCMHRRNRHLAEESDMCIAFCTKESGGTAYTVKYCQSHGIPVTFLLDSPFLSEQQSLFP